MRNFACSKSSEKRTNAAKRGCVGGFNEIDSMRSIRLIFFPALFPLFILLAGNASIQNIPAAGELAGRRIRTTVDSELARYYLESYLLNQRTGRSLIR
jgi:hypothetical protein